MMNDKFLGLGAILALFGLSGMTCINLGCESPDRTAELLTTLKQGGGRGHLVIVTDGRLGGEFSQGIHFGASKSTLSFDGDIDFGDPDEPDEVEGG